MKNVKMPLENYLTILLIKHIALAEHGWTPEEMSNLQEFEFSYNRNKMEVEYLELWTNTERTEGYQKLTFPKKLMKELGRLTEKGFYGHMV